MSEEEVRKAEQVSDALDLLRAAKEYQDDGQEWYGMPPGPRAYLTHAFSSRKYRLRSGRRVAREALWQERSLEGAIAKLESVGGAQGER